MRDLELWRLVHARLAKTSDRGAPDSRLLALLDELAEQAPRVRAAFASPLSELARDGVALVRAAAIRCLGGARAHLGMQHIIGALDDDEAKVRASGVRALVQTGREDPWRLAHACFHGRADVRRAFLGEELPKEAAAMGLYLRADVENAELAQAAPWPEQSLDLLFDMRARRFVGLAESTRRLGGTPINELRHSLLHGQRRTEAELDAWLKAFAGGVELPEISRDVVDNWCQCFDPSAASSERAMTNLWHAVLGSKMRRLARRVVVGLLRGGHAPADHRALRLCIAAEPALLACEGLELEARRSAAWVLLDSDVNPIRVPESTVLSLLESPLVRPEGGRVDLGAAICIVSLLQRRRSGVLLRHFGEEAVIDALDRDIIGWVAFCRLPQEAKGVTELLLGRMRRRNEARYQEMLAVALSSWINWTPGRAHELIKDRIPAKVAAKVLRALFNLAGTGRFSPREKIWPKLIGKLVARSSETELRGVVQEVLGDTGLRSGGLAQELQETLCASLLNHVARNLSSTSFGLSMGGLDGSALHELLRLSDGALLLSREHELALAKTLRGHDAPAVKKWAEDLLSGRRVKSPCVFPAVGRRKARRLSEGEARAITSAAIEDLESVVGPALGSPTAGLCDALGARTDIEPRQLVAVAIFGSTDPLVDIATGLDPWINDTPANWSVLRTFAVGTWQGSKELPPQCHALLHRWEEHEMAFANWLEGEHGELLERGVAAIVGLPGVCLRRTFFEAMASVVERWRFREIERLGRWATRPIIDLMVGLLDSECGVSAARVLVALYACGLNDADFAQLEDEVRELGPDLDMETRHTLDRWIRFNGLPRTILPAGRREILPPRDLMKRIRASEDLKFLEKMCCRHEMRLVHEACLRLVVLGREGQMRILALMTRTPGLRGLDVFLDSVALWTDMGCVSAVRVMAMDPKLASRLRFRICMALYERGEGGFAERALAAVAEPVPLAEEGWFSRKDRGRLRRAIPEELHFLASLASSPHPHAYRLAVRTLLDQYSASLREPSLRRALERFLEQGNLRAPDLRQRAARELIQHLPEDKRAASGLQVIALPEILDPEGGEIANWMAVLGPGLHEDVCRTALYATLIFGSAGCSELWANHIFGNYPPREGGNGATPFRRELLDQGVDPNVRKTLIAQLSLNAGRDRKLRRVAEIFAWGVRRGRELTGSVFKVHMTDKRSDFGYTFMDQKRIYVTALPLLRGDRHGSDIVEGLILHEFGHHMYHGGKDNDLVWRKAQRDGLHRILNLVADEHLERNLRAIDPSYGDRLKRLCAFAFGHSAKALKVSSLLDMLLGSSFEVLSAESLGVAFEDDCVEVQRGALLRELDHRGHPYARFVRALRMGLGNRAGDPQLARALELFRGGFRHLDMEGLYRVTLELAEIYGGSQALGKVFGGHEDLEWEGRDGDMYGAGVDDESVQREVDRLLGPPQEANKRRLGKAGRLAINVAEDTHFDPIETVERVPFNLAKHRAVAHELRRYSNRLREYLERLGLAYAPRRARLRGRAFDKTRAQAVVLRGDPRMLISREPEIHTDLFVGVVVDCSGSMTVGNRMDVAHRFGVLIAEAVAPLSGVDARFFGFTDSLIYDAGDQHHCAVTSLEAGGGNNDAAGLFHAAQAAAGSKRRAKLLVMISDGLPTECSVAALRGLVTQLGRKGLVCAQVAVRELEEECFPNYVVIEGDDVEASVRRFGEIVSRLVGQTLGRA